MSPPVASETVKWFEASAWTTTDVLTIGALSNPSEAVTSHETESPF